MLLHKSSASIEAELQPVSLEQGCAARCMTKKGHLGDLSSTPSAAIFGAAVRGGRQNAALCNEADRGNASISGGYRNDTVVVIYQ